MSYKIVFLTSAENDLKNIKSYIIKSFSLATWQDTYSKLKDSIRNLKTSPFSGSIPEELERLNLTQYRQIISGMNRVIYETRVRRRGTISIAHCAGENTYGAMPVGYCALRDVHSKRRMG